MSRQRVLQSFCHIHRACKQVFQGDAAMILATKQKINEEYKKNKEIDDPDKIEELILTAHHTADYLKQLVVQLKYSDEKDVYELKMTKDTSLGTNKLYDPDFVPPRSSKITVKDT